METREQIIERVEAARLKMQVAAEGQGLDSPSFNEALAEHLQALEVLGAMNRLGRDTP